ncbi:MAG: metallophosphoesterase [Verrucomicrobia bacterium]|nr:metallophosphoesterase [Verrucomicrobiota bacterium]
MKTRREFLASAATAAVGASLLPAAEPVAAGDHRGEVVPLGEPRFRFLQLNDTHYQSPQAEVIHPTYNQANARVHWVLDAIRGGGVFPPLDFVLHLGDLTHQHTVDRRRELSAFKALLESLPVPTYTVVGNHDNVQGEGSPEKEAPYREVFGERFDYTFEHRGLGFVVADVSGTGNADLPPARVARREQLLRRHLDSFGDRPVIVACHVPLVSVRELPVLAQTFGFDSYMVREPGLMEILRAHRHHVVAVLSGHLHLSGTVWVEGVPHIEVCGTASYPHDVAVHTVYPNCLETRFVRLPSDLLVPSTNIHGAHRFGRDFTDAGHAEYTSYLMGHAAERLVRVPLARLGAPA